VKSLTLLCKTLLPLPDKHAGLADKGMRYRKRWLDLISSPEGLQLFKKRSQAIAWIRSFLMDLDFLEVETPILQNTYGGAAARPFLTELNAIDEQKMFLRISLEIPLKKLIVGGFNRVFEIGKVFRNEGIDKTHNPEFTMLELYAQNWDYHKMMVLTENLFAHLAKKLYGTTAIGIRMDKKGNPHEVDLKTPWIRMSMKESIKHYTGINVNLLSDLEIRTLLQERTDLAPAAIQKAPRGQLIAFLFEELVEEHLIQPHHIIDHPIETTPLCKLHRNPELRAENFVERFETFILGFEFCNSYSELNDPILQRELLVLQSQMKEAGDEEAHPMDEEFLEAICQGMAPTGGLGIGIDRLMMLLLGQVSIRDVLLFPLLKNEE
jgi:lysyl-tRNA synthetase class 2